MEFSSTSSHFRLDVDTETKSPSGYLGAPPPELDRARIEAALSDICVGHTVVHHGEVDSTIPLARQLAEDASASGTLIVAETQRVGRGRHAGRVWHAPPRTSLLLTLILRPPYVPANPLHLPLVAAVAVAEAASKVLEPFEADTAARVALKWPNDVLILPDLDAQVTEGPGAKVAGVLAETAFHGEICRYALLSTGINVNQTPRQMANVHAPTQPGLSATSLRAALSTRELLLDRGALLIALCRELNGWLADTSRAGWADDLLAAYCQRLETLGRPVKVMGRAAEPAGMAPLLGEGVAVDVNQNGALIVKQVDGVHRTFLDGEVSLR